MTWSRRDKVHARLHDSHLATDNGGPPSRHGTIFHVQYAQLTGKLTRLLQELGARADENSVEHASRLRSEIEVTRDAMRVWRDSNAASASSMDRTHEVARGGTTLPER